MLAGGATGLYGHVEENRKRSILLFGGFIVAIQLMALMALLPWTMVFDQAHSPLVSPIGYATRYMLPVAVVAMLVYAVRLWWFVGRVRKTVGFRYVDNADEPRFCRLLEPLAIAAGIAVPFAAVIESPARNAFACGMRARHMVVVATRGLIDGLDDDELAAVLAHEIIHIRNSDTMLLASANTFMATLTMAQGMRQVRFDDWRQMIGMVLMPMLIPLYLLMAFLTQVALRIGYSSRAAIGSAREMIADAEAVRLTQNPAAMASALRKIEGQSRIEGLGLAEEAMMIDGRTEGPLATHPPISQRIAALARTTGSMIFEGGTRLDTRTPALATASSRPLSGQGDDALLRVATLATAPAGASMWEIFRRTRDPERNILGFNKRLAVHFGLVIMGVAGFGQTQTGARLFDAQRDLAGLAREAGDVQRTMLACDLAAIGIEPTGMACDTKGLEAKSQALVTRMGGPDELAWREEERKTVESLLARRCFNAAHAMTPAALTGPPQGKSYNIAPGRFRLVAAASVEPILQAPPGPMQDRAIRDYVDFRVLMLGNALYFNGRAELEALNANYRREDHQNVIALLGERLKDPGFTAGMDTHRIAKLRLMAIAPFDALPCDVVPAIRRQATGAPAPG